MQRRSTTARVTRPSPLPGIPTIAAWTSNRGALTNLLAFGVVAAAGEWLAHQVEYLIVYGSRFPAVMAATPHHLYMARLGLGLMMAWLAIAVVAGLVLIAGDRERRLLVGGLPSRVRRYVPRAPMHVEGRLLGQTAIALFVCQVLLYALQENVEVAAVSGSWTGASVLVGATHITVLPLHAALALAGATLLSSLSAVLSWNRRSVGAARLFVDILRPRPQPRSVPSSLGSHVPDLRLIAGILCLRSPPRAA